MVKRKHERRPRFERFRERLEHGRQAVRKANQASTRGACCLSVR